jgi:NitT/TauT family transport system permease protein
MKRTWIAPLMFGLLMLALWQGVVSGFGIAPYNFPGPFAVLAAFLADPAGLLGSLAATLAVTAVALVIAALLGGLLALGTSFSDTARAAILPWAVVLQVTPIVAIAPLIIAWVQDPFASLVVCAVVIAFFPLYANTVEGLSASPPELIDLCRLYGAGRFRMLTVLRMPQALPYFMAGLRVSGGLALVGAIVAEFVAGSGGFASGLAYRILEAGYRLQRPRQFAALILLAIAGVAINLTLGALGRAVARRSGGLGK